MLGLTDFDALGDTDLETLGDSLGDGDIDGETDELCGGKDGLLEGLTLLETLADGDRLGLSLGLTDAEALPPIIAVRTIPVLWLTQNLPVSSQSPTLRLIS